MLLSSPLKIWKFRMETHQSVAEESRPNRLERADRQAIDYSCGWLKTRGSPHVSPRRQQQPGGVGLWGAGIYTILYYKGGYCTQCRVLLASLRTSVEVYVVVVVVLVLDDVRRSTPMRVSSSSDGLILAVRLLYYGRRAGIYPARK